MTKAVVFYHANCADGFGAALAAWLVLGEHAQYVPCSYGDEPLDVTGLRVFILDFSFDESVMARLDQQAVSLVLLDHHKSAQTAIQHFQCRCGGVKFDLTRSGARMAWDYFHAGKPVPALISHIQDRDLWTWELAQSKDYLAALDAVGYDFAAWKQLMEMTPAQHGQFVARGNAMNEKYQALVDSLAEPAACMPVTLLGHLGLMVNAPTLFASELGNQLALRCGTFAAIWKLDTPQRVKVSLRSVRSFDVGALAQRMGGGGHPQSSSFYIPLSRLPELIAGTLTP